MYSGSEAGSYLRPIDFVYQSTLGLRVRKKKRRADIGGGDEEGGAGRDLLDSDLVTHQLCEVHLCPCSRAIRSTHCILLPALQEENA